MQNDNDYALIIGIEEYKEMAKLNGPVNDAKDFLEWACNETGGNIPEANCFLIQASKDPYKPLQDDIDTGLETIIGDGSKGYRRLYFFFAGHGYGVAWDTNGLCLPGWTSLRRRNALSSKAYLDYVVESKFFTEVYFFLDCCRDRMINASALTPSLGAILPAGQNVTSLVLFAADFSSKAYEDPELDPNTKVQGYFTKALLQGLRGAAADKNGNITADGLTDFTKRRTSELAALRQKTQTVRPLFSGMGTMSQLIIKEGINVEPTSVTITFISEGLVNLIGRDLNVIWEKQISKDEISPIFTLDKGLYILENTTTGNNITIKIDGTSKHKEYEF